MSEPSPRWLSRRRADGRLPAARGVLGAGALAGLAVALPLSLSTTGRLASLAERAMRGAATLGQAAAALLTLALPLSVAMALGALAAGALHVRLVGRGGAGAEAAGRASLAWVLAATAGAALVLSALRASLEGGSPGALASSLAVRAFAAVVVVSIVFAARALARARAERDEAYAREPDHDRPREAASRGR